MGGRGVVCGAGLLLVAVRRLLGARDLGATALHLQRLPYDLGQLRAHLQEDDGLFRRCLNSLVHSWGQLATLEGSHLLREMSRNTIACEEKRFI